MNTYKVEVYEEMGGYCYIKAESAEDAQEEAEYILESEGVEALPGLDVTHRESGTSSAEEQK